MINEELSQEDKSKKLNSPIKTKKKISILKNIRGISNFMNNSSNYWTNTFQNVMCTCDRTEDLTKESSPPPSTEKKTNSIFTVTSTIKNNLPPIVKSEAQPLSSNRKEWTKEESNILFYNYFTLNNNNFEGITKLLPNKTASQIIQKIKKLEIKSRTVSFSRQDDLRIVELVEIYGKNWKKISTFFTGCTPEVIENRYKNKLDPKLKRTKFTEEEDEKILALYSQFGNKWKEIGSFFPDRNVNMIKNRFYSFLKKQFNNPSISTSNNSVSSSSVDTYSIAPTSGTPLLNYSDNNSSFKFNEDSLDLDPDPPSRELFNLPEDNFLDLKKLDSIDEGNLIRESSLCNIENNKNHNDCFFETYQKVFPANQDNKVVDLNDSCNDEGQASNDMYIDNSTNSNNDVDEKSTNFTLKSKKEIEETHKLFKESNNLEEILRKIDSFQFDLGPETKKYNFKNNLKFLELFERKEKTVKHQQILYTKLNELKQAYVLSLKSNLPQNKILMSINNTLLQLISIAKMQILISKQLSDMKNKLIKKANNQMKCD